MQGRDASSRGAAPTARALPVAAAVAIAAAATSCPGSAVAAPFLPAVQIRPHDVTEADLARIRQVGFGGIRFGLRREIVFPKSGGAHWAAYDRVAAWAKRHRLRMIVTLFDGRAVNNTAQSQATWTKDFTVFAAQAARRYPTGITWEIWNEPNGSRYWPQWAGAAGYTRLAASVCSAIRKVHPRADITAGALITGSGGSPYHDYIKLLIPLVASGCVDTIGIHPYRQSAPETVVGSLANLRKQYPRVRFVITEWGYTTAGKAYPSAIAGAWASRIPLASWLAQSEIAVLYEWRDGGVNPIEREQNFGLVNKGRTAKSSLAYVTRSLGWLNNDPTRCVTERVGSYCLRRKKQGSAGSLLLWSDSPYVLRHRELSLRSDRTGQRDLCRARNEAVKIGPVPKEACD